ncbi:MAG TPA: hypothetical protein DEA73_08720 [Peptococcaceae bacterium]|nr:hypothetical protein [Peptococcaceae bacterium]
MLKFPGKKEATKKKQATQEEARKAVQEWLPFKDIAGGVLVRKDAQVAAILRVEPFNLSLKSETEKKRIITAVFEAINGLKEPFQIVSLGRPVDLDAYLRELQGKARETTSFIRRKLLQEYIHYDIHYVSALVSTGEALERRYYLLLPGKEREEVLQRAHDLASNLERAGLKVTICEEQEIIDLLFVFLHPAQAAFERPPALAGPYLPPLLGAV